MKREHWRRTEYIIVFLFAVFVLLSCLMGWPAGRKMAGNFSAFALTMIVLVPAVFIFIGIVDVWVPKEAIEKHIGEGSGARGAFYVVLLAFFQGGPLYVAFPVAHLLLKKGCSVRNIFMYIGSFSALKIPMVTFEITFLGWRFSLLRAVVSLPVFLLIAEAMAKKVRAEDLPMSRM